MFCAIVAIVGFECGFCTFMYILMCMHVYIYIHVGCT